MKTMETYTPRIVEAQIAAALANVPALCLEGAKGVGKTFTAKRFAKTVLELDDPAVRESLLNNLDALATLPRPVLIDEWQQVPETWNKVRRLVDAGAPNGSYLLAGSISKTDTTLHTGAGRILSLHMRPFALPERFAHNGEPRVSIAAMLGQDAPFSLPLEGRTAVGYPGYVEEITRSGFPGMRRAGGGFGGKLLTSYLQYAVTRDFAAQGVSVRRPATLTRWLKAYAAAVATDAGYGAILDASTPGEGDKPARGTTLAYRDALGAWAEGGAWLSRLRASPRHHLADPALVCSLLGVSGKALLTGEATSVFDDQQKTLSGRLFESLVVQTARVCADAAGASIHYLRTQNGAHEVDIIIQKERRVLALEVKLAPTVDEHETRHLRWLRGQLGEALVDAAVITTGPVCYRRRADGVGVIPAALLGV